MTDKELSGEELKVAVRAVVDKILDHTDDHVDDVVFALDTVLEDLSGADDPVDAVCQVTDLLEELS